MKTKKDAYHIELCDIVTVSHNDVEISIAARFLYMGLDIRIVITIIILCTSFNIISRKSFLCYAQLGALFKDGSSSPKGVDVLSAVSDDIDCVFLHLLENPGLCNRSAVDATTRSCQQGINLDESSSSGKRELAQSQSGKEPRRRLA
jgi:hypothetical protein